MPTLQISVTSTAQTYWVAVDDQDVPLVDGVGQVEVAAGEHILSWWMMGKAGDTLSIVGASPPGGAVCVSVKGSKIPPPHSRGGGVKRFSV